MSSIPKFETLLVTTPSTNVYQVEINRPDKMNSMNKTMWKEFIDCFNAINEQEDCRAVIVSGAGRMFTAGLDFTDMADLAQFYGSDIDIARKAKTLRKLIATYQESFTVIEKCTKPVIAAIHGACLGAGTSLVSACDIRYCTQDAYFQIKEVDVGLAADVGVLQRLPKTVGNDSLAREMAFTARKLFAAEALQMGLVSRVLPNKEEMMKYALETANLIASKSPVAVQGSKIHMNYSRDHSVADGLDYMTTWNMSMLLSEDLMKSAMAAATRSKEPPIFSKY